MPFDTHRMFRACGCPLFLLLIRTQSLAAVPHPDFQSVTSTVSNDFLHRITPLTYEEARKICLAHIRVSFENLITHGSNIEALQVGEQRVQWEWECQECGNGDCTSFVPGQLHWESGKT